MSVTTQEQLAALDFRAQRDNVSVCSLSVRLLRATPMDAVLIALRRDGDDEASRLVWGQWINIVLGLPYCHYAGADGSIVLQMEREVATHMESEVQTIDEIRSRLSGA